MAPRMVVSWRVPFLALAVLPLFAATSVHSAHVANPLPESAPVAEVDRAAHLARRQSCPWGTVASGGQCKCKTGWTPKQQGQCCSPNSYWGANGCTCDQGTSWRKDLDTCYGKTPTCPWGTIPNGNQNCVCRSGWWAAFEGQCCSPNSHWNNGCVCNDGYSWNKQYLRCDPGTGTHQPPPPPPPPPSPPPPPRYPDPPSSAPNGDFACPFASDCYSSCYFSRSAGCGGDIRGTCYATAANQCSNSCGCFDVKKFGSKCDWSDGDTQSYAPQYPTRAWCDYSKGILSRNGVSCWGCTDSDIKVYCAKMGTLFSGKQPPYPC